VTISGHSQYRETVRSEAAIPSLSHSPESTETPPRRFLRRMLNSVAAFCIDAWSSGRRVRRSTIERTRRDATSTVAG